MSKEKQNTENNENSAASAAEKKPKNLRKLKYGSMAAAIVILVVAIVVVVNIIAGVLTKRYPMKLDLTADNRFELCDETINVLKGLDKDVEIAVMMPEETLSSYTYYNMIPKILEKYQMYAKDGNGSIEVQYIDMNKDPDKATKYTKYYNGSITEGSVVVYCDEKVEASSVLSLFATSSSSNSSYYSDPSDQEIYFTGESVLTSAIVSVTDAHIVKAAFMTYADAAHQSYAYAMFEYQGQYMPNASAYDSEAFRALLIKNGYEIDDTDIVAANEIDPELYDLVVIPAIAYDITPNVVEKLEDFLYNGGNYGKQVVYLAGGDVLDLPNLDEFLNKWNLEVGDAVVRDDENMIKAGLSTSQQAVDSPIVTIDASAGIGELPNNKLPIVAPNAREVKVLTKNGDYVANNVLNSASTSYLTPLADGVEYSEENGSRAVAAISKREKADGADVMTSSVLVFGSVYMADDSLLGNTSAYNNANFLLNAVNSITGKADAVVIPQKNLQTQTLALTASQAKIVKTVVLYIIPLLVVIAGIIVFVRRRNR